VFTIAPRSPVSVGSSVAIPAALFTMQRKVPTVFSPSTHSKSATLKGTISLVSLLRPMVLPPRPPPAQLTRIRSWPFAARALAKPASTEASSMTSTSQKVAPISLAMASPVAGFLSNSATFAPSSRSARAVAAPRPEAPPVITAETDESIFTMGLPGRYPPNTTPCS
jgi:hypothetical protein